MQRGWELNLYELNNEPYKELKFYNYMSKQKTDLDKIEDNVTDMFDSIEHCFDALSADKKRASGFLKGLFGFGVHCTKLTYNLVFSAIKYTPKAVTTIAKVKRDVSDEIVGAYNEIQKEKLEDNFNRKIKELKKKNGKKI